MNIPGGPNFGQLPLDNDMANLDNDPDMMVASDSGRRPSAFKLRLFVRRFLRRVFPGCDYYIFNPPSQVVPGTTYKLALIITCDGRQYNYVATVYTGRDFILKCFKDTDIPCRQCEFRGNQAAAFASMSLSSSSDRKQMEEL